MKIISITVVALVTLASSGAAFAGKSPFCYGGSPTPQHVCDIIKANQKPPHIAANPRFTSMGNSGVVRH
jgi:hypothetical protein